MKKIILVIIDGWGQTQDSKKSAISIAKTPYYDELLKNYPNSSLIASGKEVGLPDSLMGNSEVGHINIGAGRTVDQSLLRINKAISSGEFEKNPMLKEVFDLADIQEKPIHLLGLVSDGGIHSHIDHLKEIILLAAKKNIKINLHAFTDGRDTSPNSSIKYLQDIEKCLKNNNGRLCTIIGRYYAMDRDRRWERTKIAYDALVNSKGTVTNDWVSAIENSYNKKITDEFFMPIIIKDENKNTTNIKNNDIVICANFRTDRSRQITEVLTQKPFPAYDMKPLDLTYITMTEYDKSFKNIRSLFQTEQLTNTLGEVLSKNEKKQLRIAETEKYPHVTYFLSGGREKNFPNEDRILCDSPKVPTYDMQPEMSAREITSKLSEAISSNKYDFICVNYANPDMVGHTGNFEATISACETIDKCLEQIVEIAQENDYSLIITSDHGNAEKMLDDDNRPFTSHTNEKVPFIFVSNEKYIIRDGILADIAPTILKYLELEKPPEMTGTQLISS